jgi:SAM-dependent methyltransferase
MERLTSESANLVRQYHEARYYFAQRYTRSQRVLDVACGDGYGSLILANAGASVTSVDPRANIAHPLPNFLRKFAEELTFESEFDVAVSFETIEHAISPRTFLQQLWLALKPKGSLIMSFPNDWGETRFHLHNTASSTLQMIGQYFDIKELRGQNRRVQPQPIPITEVAFWVENILVVGERRDQMPARVATIEEIYNEVALKQVELSRSITWRIRQAIPRIKTALKRRGICRRP